MPGSIRHEPALAGGLRGEQRWQIPRKQFCECDCDWKFMQIRFADGFEPHGTLRRIKTDEREGLATIQLTEAFQLHPKRANYRTHPILKMAQPAEPTKGFGIFSHHMIRTFQIAGLENSVFVVLQEMRDCVMNREPVHPFR